MAANEVSGVWFTTARAYCLERFGAGALESVVQATPLEHREPLIRPANHRWYPEEAMQSSVAAMSRILAEGDQSRFMRIIEGCTEEGVHQVFRVFLRLSTPAFVARQVPTMWKQIRRGSGVVSVEAFPGSARIHYRDFPFFDDVHYRWLTEASLRALVRLCTRREPSVQVVSHSQRTLVVDVAYFAT